MPHLLVEVVKERDWFPTAATDAVGRPCIPVELKVSKQRNGRVDSIVV